MAGKRLPRGIDRLPAGTYRARLTVDNIVHTIGTFRTIGDARAALDIARAEKARGTFIPPAIRRERLKAEQAARLAKADLASGMVGEFPEMQGIAGYYYAKHDGEHRQALEQQGGRIKVPCLRIEENGQSTWLYESKAIIAYLDQRFAG